MPETVSPVIPFLRYNDARAALDWLVKAFDLAPIVVVDTPDGGIAYAALRFGTGAVSIGPAGSEGPLDVRSPRDLPAVNQGIYLHVADDVASHYARATSAGAEVVMGLTETDYGSTEFAVKDLEGHLWCFGTYLPSEEEQAHAQT